MQLKVSIMIAIWKEDEDEVAGGISLQVVMQSADDVFTY